MSKIRSRDRRLYNKDLAPTDKKKKLKAASLKLKNKDNNQFINLSGENC